MSWKIKLFISNLLFVLLVGVIVVLFYSFPNTPTTISFILLLLTLLTPSIYMFFSSKIYNDAVLSNVMAPSLIITSVFILVNTIACIVLLCIGANLSFKGLILTELIIGILYAIAMFVVSSLTKYIRNVNKK